MRGPRYGQARLRAASALRVDRLTALGCQSLSTHRYTPTASAEPQRNRKWGTNFLCHIKHFYLIADIQFVVSGKSKEYADSAALIVERSCAFPRRTCCGKQKACEPYERAKCIS